MFLVIYNELVTLIWYTFAVIFEKLSIRGQKCPKRQSSTESSSAKRRIKKRKKWQLKIYSIALHTAANSMPFITINCNQQSSITAHWSESKPTLFTIKLTRKFSTSNCPPSSKTTVTFMVFKLQNTCPNFTRRFWKISFASAD